MSGNTNFLSRNEIIRAFKSKDLMIEDPGGGIERWADTPYSSDNPFQQCSIDLRVGSIYVPETEPEKPGGSLAPKADEHILEVGQTVMIRTKEKITLPDDVGGICFSPSRLALKAVLMTNMGHVDPGYSGNLHFIALNMGRETFTLRGNDVICTMIFFRLSEKVPPRGEELFVEVPGVNGASIPAVIADYLPKLSKDFVNVAKRAEDIRWGRIRFIFVIPILVAIISAIIPLYQTIINKPWDKELTRLDSRVESVEKKADFEGRIKALEIAISQSREGGITRR